MNGKIIIIEGLDGCGKSTQLELLRERFTDCRFLTFPNYDTPAGAVITDYLSGGIPDPDPVRSAYSASMFYAADRYISCRKDWGADHAQGKTIISARYTTSNAIYQMTKLPQSEWESYCRWLYALEYDRLGIPAPDTVLFLDVPVEVSQKLLTRRYDGDEQKKDIHEADPGYLRRCYEASRYAAAHDPYATWEYIPCCEGDSLRPVEAIHAALAERICTLLGK